MANLTVDNTTKSGWITIVFNDMSSDYISAQFPIDRVDAVDIEIINGNILIEFYVSHIIKPLYLSDVLAGGLLTVDAVNGVAPTSLNDLKLKLLALL